MRKDPLTSDAIPLPWLQALRDKSVLITRDEALADLPGGIDYGLWSKAVKPASREGFADSLDVADLMD